MIHAISRRTAHREFSLRPDPVLNQNFLYLLAVASQKFPVEIYAFSFLSNHLHLLLKDLTGGAVVDFCQWLFSMMARSTNHYRGRRENLWSTDKVSLVEVAPRFEDILDKLSYVICNPVTSQLVSQVRHWPGVKILAHEIGQVTIRVQKPAFFYDPDGGLPDEVELVTHLPTIPGVAPEDLRRALCRRCREIEREWGEGLAALGRKPMGRKAVRRQSPTARPRTPAPSGSLIPHVACKDPALRVAMLGRRKVFQLEYREALGEFRAGARDVVFPEGTFQMVRLFGVDCGPRSPP